MRLCSPDTMTTWHHWVFAVWDGSRSRLRLADWQGHSSTSAKCPAVLSLLTHVCCSSASFIHNARHAHCRIGCSRDPPTHSSGAKLETNPVVRDVPDTSLAVPTMAEINLVPSENVARSNPARRDRSRPETKLTHGTYCDSERVIHLRTPTRQRQHNIHQVTTSGRM